MVFTITLIESKEHNTFIYLKPNIMKVYIKWEHGDSDFTTNSSFNISKETLHRFLDYIFEMKGWISNCGYNNLGHFADGHNEKSDEHVDAINKKYNNEFDEYLEPDRRYSYPRASIESIWLKDGNLIRHIVWEKTLKENLITLPEIGTMIDCSTGHIDGYGQQTFGKKYDKYTAYQTLNELPLDEGEDGYNKLTAKIIDIGICYGRDFKEYKSDFTKFHYIVLCEYEGYIFSTSMYGHDPKMTPKEKFLYYH